MKTRVVVTRKELPKPPEILVQEGIIKGQALRKDTRQPVSGAQVSLSANSRDYSSPSWITEADGSFQISLSDLSPSLDEGEYRLVVHLAEKDWDLWQAQDYWLPIG